LQRIVDWAPRPDAGARHAQKRICTERRRRDRRQMPLLFTPSSPTTFGGVLTAPASSATPTKAPASARCLRFMWRSSASRPVPLTIIARKATENKRNAPFTSWSSLISPPIWRVAIVARPRSPSIKHATVPRLYAK